MGGFACFYDQRMGPNPEPNLRQLSQMAIESVLLVIPIMASVINQAVTLPTAALAMEADLWEEKKSALKVCRTESESNIRSVSL